MSLFRIFFNRSSKSTEAIKEYEKLQHWLDVLHGTCDLGIQYVLYKYILLR